LASAPFAASAAGYDELQRWAQSAAAGHELVFGVEGVGSWGAGLRQHLQHGGHAVDLHAGKSTTPSTRSHHPRQHQPETRAYLNRRIAEAKAKREALRALKRH
jgi:hypothetical protein